MHYPYYLKSAAFHYRVFSAKNCVQVYQGYKPDQVAISVEELPATMVPRASECTKEEFDAAFEKASQQINKRLFQ